MTSYNQDGRVGPWAAEKLEFLGKYLSAYTTILRKQEWCDGYLYIDAFAGAGRTEVRASENGSVRAEDLLFDVSEFGRDDDEAQTYIDGSPYVALGIEHQFSRYYFVEKNPERVSRLNDIKTEFSSTRNINVVSGDAIQAISKIVSNSGYDWRSHRAVIFLDPFGMQVPWNIIEKIAETRAIEIILNFPVGMAIQRLLPRSGVFTAEQRERLNRYFGLVEWEEVIYQRSIDLFGATDVQKVQNSGNRLVSWYRDRLKLLFGFSSLPRLVRNSRGSHLYYLLFAGPNENGAKIASEVLRQGEVVRAN